MVRRGNKDTAMKDKQTQARRQPNEGFWKTAKGRAILAAREREADREVWRRFDAWA